MLHGTFSHEPPGLSVSACWAGASASTSPTGCAGGAHRGRPLAESQGWRFEQIPQGARALACVPTVNKASWPRRGVQKRRLPWESN
jgi:hypothetical protein